MNVRDFLFNFCDPTVKVCIQKVVTGQILFYGRANGIDRLEILNKIVERVAYDIKAECLTIIVRNDATGVTYHLPEDWDYTY